MKHKISRTLGRVSLTVLLLLLALGVLLPSILTVAASLMTQREMEYRYGAVLDGGLAENGTLALWPNHVTGEQYVTALFQTPRYLVRFFNAVSLTLPVVLGQLALASMSAYSLYRCRNRFRTGIYFLYVLLMLLPYQVTLLPHYLVAQRLGLLGSVWSIILPGIVSPFSVFLISRRMRQIPLAQVECSMLDGAGEWRIFTRVCLPQCYPTLWAVSMLVFAEYWNMIEQPLVLLKEPHTYPLSVFLAQIGRQESGVAFAVAVLFMLPPLVFFLLGQRHLAAGFGAEEGGDSHSSKRRAFRLAMAACVVLGVVALWGVMCNIAKISTQFIPRVTVATADAAVIDGETYARVLPREAVCNDEYGCYVMSVTAHTEDSASVYRVDYEPVTVVAESPDLVALAEGGDWSTVIITYDRHPAENSYVTLN